MALADILQYIDNQQRFYVDQLKEWARHNKARIEKLPPDWADELRKEYAAELEGHKNFNEKEQADV